MNRPGFGGEVDMAAELPAQSFPIAGAITFEQLYEAERRALLSLALALTGRRDVAEDLVQEAFLQAHRHWRRVSTLERPGAWVRRVLLNLATSRGRRLATEARGLARLGGRRERTEGAEPVMAADSVEFWSVVRTLPARQAQVVVLYYGEDRSTADIAAVLDMAEGTVRAQLTNARRTLAVRLGLEAEEDA